MPDIFDIIHRLTYQLDDQGLQDARAEIEKQSKELDGLQKKQKQLSETLSSTSTADAKAREKVTAELQKNSKEIDKTISEVQRLAVTNKDYNAVLQQQGDVTENLSRKMRELNEQKQVKLPVPSVIDYTKQMEEAQRQLSQIAAENEGRSALEIPVQLKVDDAGVAKLNELKHAFDEAFANPSAILSTGEIEKLDEYVIKAKGDFQTFNATVAFLEKKLTELEPGTQQFQELSNAIKTGTAVLKQYDTLFDDATKSVKGLNPALTKLEPAVGKLGKSTINVNYAMAGFQSIIRDAPYGVIGIGNNITQLADGFSYLKRETGSSGAALKAFVTGFAGPAGIATAISLVVTLITTLVQKYGSLGAALDALFSKMTDAERAQKGLTNALKEAGKEYEKAYADVSRLREQINLAKEGFLDKTKVVAEYNKTIGKTTGQVKTLDEAEKALNEHADEYIQFTLLKAAANVAYQKAAEAAEKEMEAQRKSVVESLTFWDQVKEILKHPLTAGTIGTANDAILRGLQQSGEKTRKQAIEEAAKDKKTFAEIADDLERQAAEIAKKHNFDFFGTTDKDKNKKSKTDKNKYALPFLSSVDEAAIKEYQGKLKEILALFDNHWADYRIKAATEYKNGILSKKEFDDQMLYLEALRLNKVKELLDQFAARHPYVEFFKSQQADINRQLAPIVNDLKVQLPKKADLAPLSKAWQDYINHQKKETDNGVKQLLAYINAYQDLSNAAISAFRDISSAQEQESQRQIQIEQSRVARAQQIADRGNAEALQKEEERLQKLQKQHEQQVKNEVALNSIMTESNAIAAVVRAAADPAGGGILAPATIALVIAAIAGGIVAVNNIAKDAPGFRDGIVDIAGPGTKRSDSIPARLSRGESIMTAEATERNKEILERMNKGERIQEMVERTIGRPVVMLPASNPERFGNLYVRGNQDQQSINDRMLKRLSNIEHAIRNKKEATISIDQRGIYAIVTEYTQQTERRKRL